MRLLILAVALAAAWLLLSRSRAGVCLGNEVRALSDRMMLGFLQVTSEFEKEL